MRENMISNRRKLSNEIISFIRELVKLKKEIAEQRRELEVLNNKVFPERILSIKAERFVYPEDDSLLVRDYYGTGLIIPKWVRFVAFDNNSNVWGYEEQPEISEVDKEWSTKDKGKTVLVGWRSKNTARDKWRNSLREVQL
jgi:hypothetical protein|nr:MAG TPA: hypothetical protein [Caudoviricetes sp.]